MMHRTEAPRRRVSAVEPLIGSGIPLSSTSHKVDVVWEHVAHASCSDEVDQLMDPNRNAGAGRISCQGYAAVVGERHIAEDDVVVHVNGDQVMLDVPGTHIALKAMSPSPGDSSELTKLLKLV